MEKRRTPAQHQLAVHPLGISGYATQKIMNSLLETIMPLQLGARLLIVCDAVQ
jgi:hypothetical protein